MSEDPKIALERAVNANKEVYMGDGLYALFDGFGMQLRAPKQGGDLPAPPAGCAHVVYLEPEVLWNFIKFAKNFYNFKDDGGEK
jgi:hypothetical protein